MFNPGEVYRYSYLWAWQFDAGEESGRKDRPACLLVRPPSQPDLMFLFAITSQNPQHGRACDAIPASECRRVGISAPAWILLDEYNIALETDLQDFASVKPMGKFSPDYIKHLVRKALTLAKVKPIRRIDRN